MLIVDPRSAVIVEQGTHDPVLPADVFSQENIARCLQEAHAIEIGTTRSKIQSGDGVTLPSSDGALGAEAGVLLALVPRASGWSVLLTQRSEHLRHHAGQVSFPGGRRDPEDIDIVATAQREAQEEIGLPPHTIEVLGTLPAYQTVSDYRVITVVGIVRQPWVPQIAPDEVAALFEVPLSYLMNPRHHQVRRLNIQGQERTFWAMEWTVMEPDGRRRDLLIWGATAALLRNFYWILANSLPSTDSIIAT